MRALGHADILLCTSFDGIQQHDELIRRQTYEAIPSPRDTPGDSWVPDDGAVFIRLDNQYQMAYPIETFPFARDNHPTARYIVHRTIHILTSPDGAVSYAPPAHINARCTASPTSKDAVSAGPPEPLKRGKRIIG